LIKFNAFILAAGLGKRLRPVTEYIPKPLLPILGRPVLQIILEKISALPLDIIGINLHYQKEVIENWINQSAFRNQIRLFPEDTILGTGGAIKNAEGILQNKCFLVHNSDIISDIDLEKLIEFHLSSNNLLTLAAHNYPEFNNLLVDEKGFLKDISFISHNSHNTLNINNNLCNTNTAKLILSKGNLHQEGENRCLAFTGIAVYSPEFLKFLPSGASSITDAWLRAISSGFKIGTYSTDGCYWSDMGTPASYARTVLHQLSVNGENVYIHPSASGCRYVDMNGFVVIEKDCIIENHIAFRNCILLPEARIAIKTDPGNPSEASVSIIPGSKKQKDVIKRAVPLLVENSILGPGFYLQLQEAAITCTSANDDPVIIGTGGSDRKYFRIRKKGRTSVLMQCSQEDKDFIRHMEYTLFFRKYFIPVPALLEVREQEKQAYFEDLGDITLFNWLKCPRSHNEIERIYTRIIDILSEIHSTLINHANECTLLQDRVFDYDHLRWETGYFIKWFVESIKSYRINDRSLLDQDLHRLAKKTDSFQKTIVHRDFQSQNIMITRGKYPRIIDYQGARIGPPAYDVVSLLWDPYYRIDDKIRKRLLEHYILKMIDRTTPVSNKHHSTHSCNSTLHPIPPSVINDTGVFSDKIFLETLIHCRLQRHMQALGAYGYLSSVKGKKHFLRFVPEGLRLLQEAAFLSKEEYPGLYNLIMTF
jgi:NDP-sugar pyrophosphorylase family protein/aminoglycoside/choline kinase family phosphotransferase